MFQVEVKWNREFHFVPHGRTYETLKSAVEYSEVLKDMGDGASVKDTQVVDQDGNIVYVYGKVVGK